MLAHLIIASATGGSPGKLIVGIRVVDKNTFAKAGFGRHLGRFILWIADSAPWFCGVPLVGLITGLASKGHRRVGDMVAGTLVVDKKMVDHPVAIVGVNEIAPAYPPTAAPPAPPIGQAPTSPPPPTTPPVVATAPTTPPVTAAPITPPEAPPPEAPPPEAPPPEAATPVSAQPAAEATPSRPGVDAPQWDPARNTYIQWDPELGEWMEWSEAAGRWIPISQ